MRDIRTYKGENWRFTELADQTGREARAYFLWFKTQTDKRIEYLRGYLAEEKVNCTLDYSEESLSDLWIWFRTCMEFVREKENEAKQEKEDSSGSRQEDASLEELYGILDMIEMDIAIYFAETLIHNHPQLHWDYVKKRPKLYAYHQPVVKGFDDSDFFLLPWQIIETCAAGEDCYGEDNNLRDVYKVWERHVIRA